MQRRLITEREKNEKYLKNFSDHTLSDHQVSVLSLAKGLKCIETPVTNENKISGQQLLRDFEQFARRMRLRLPSFGVKERTGESTLVMDSPVPFSNSKS